MRKSGEKEEIKRRKCDILKNMKRISQIGKEVRERKGRGEQRKEEVLKIVSSDLDGALEAVVEAVLVGRELEKNTSDDKLCSSSNST